MHSLEMAQDQRGVAQHSRQPGSGRRVEWLRRSDGAIVFRCERCGREVLDLRSVFLAHRAGIGWRIECAQHDEADWQVDGGRIFGGGLHALDAFADLARSRWFEPAELFRAFLRLRAQASGIYREPEA